VVLLVVFFGKTQETLTGIFVVVCVAILWVSVGTALAIVGPKLFHIYFDTESDTAERNKSSLRATNHNEGPPSSVVVVSSAATSGPQGHTHRGSGAQNGVNGNGVHNGVNGAPPAVMEGESNRVTSTSEPFGLMMLDRFDGGSATTSKNTTSNHSGIPSTSDIPYQPPRATTSASTAEGIKQM